MKNFNVNWRNVVSAIIITTAILFAMQIKVAAQSEIQFNGLYNCPDSSMYNFKVLECPNDQECQVAFYGGSEPNLTLTYKASVYKSKITNALDAGGCTIDGKPLKKTTAPPQNNKENNQPPTKETKPSQAGRFKIGDRVLASPAMLEDDKFFEKCTVIKDYMKTEGADAYRVVCDSPDGGIGREANVGGKFIRAWANATPPPTAPECSFEEPPGKVTGASKPSAELFKRVFFEWLQSKSNGRQIGLTFQTFQMGKPFPNRVTNNGLLYRAAPEGATIYPIKANYIFCDRYEGQTIRWVYENQFECFKDKFGDWVCNGGTAQPKSQIYLPNK